MKKIILNFIVLLSFFCLSKSSAQVQVLKPAENISPWMNLSEWILRNANLTFDSYDLNTFKPYWRGYASDVDDAPLIFINGVRHNNSLIEMNELVFPNISLNSIDSILINTNSEIVNGYFAENGSIKIFLKKHYNSIHLERGLANEINDPGPHISSELRTPNVEFIDNFGKLSLWFPKKMRTSLFISGNIYSRTNTLIYDDNSNGMLFGRTIGLNDSGEKRLQRNVIIDALLINNFDTDRFEINLNNSFTRNDNYYLWSPAAGIELPFSLNKLQSGLSIQTKNKGFFRGLNLSYSFSDYDSLFGAGPKAIELEKTSLNQSTSFQLSNIIHINLESHFLQWMDRITKESFSSTLWRGSLILKKYPEYVFVIGNQVQGIIINFKGKNSQISLGTLRSSHRNTSYHYNRIKDGIGFSLVDQIEDRIVDDSEFINLYSEFDLHKKIDFESINIWLDTGLRHFWRLSDYRTSYEYIQNSLLLNSNIEYYDATNVGVFYSTVKLKSFISSFLYSNTMISTNLNLYGLSRFKKKYERVPSWSFSQALKYRLDDNAELEILFNYTPERNINDFEQLESEMRWPTVRVRPIKFISSTAKMWFFDKSLILSLSLRNLLDSVESYNTNGQYYNMSIHVSGSLTLGKK